MQAYNKKVKKLYKNLTIEDVGQLFKITLNPKQTKAQAKAISLLRLLTNKGL